VQGQSELFKIVRALGPTRRLTHLLDCRQEQPDQNGNDGDHNKQFNESETRPSQVARLHDRDSRDEMMTPYLALVANDSVDFMKIE
jgi:hypothetical protein